MEEVFVIGATAGGEDWKAHKISSFHRSLLLAVYLTNTKYVLQDKLDAWPFILHPQYLDRQAFRTIGLTSSSSHLPKHQNT